MNTLMSHRLPLEAGKPTVVWAVQVEPVALGAQQAEPKVPVNMAPTFTDGPGPSSPISDLRDPFDNSQARSWPGWTLKRPPHPATPVTKGTSSCVAADIPASEAFVIVASLSEYLCSPPVCVLNSPQVSSPIRSVRNFHLSEMLGDLYVLQMCGEAQTSPRVYVLLVGRVRTNLVPLPLAPHSSWSAEQDHIDPFSLFPANSPSESSAISRGPRDSQESIRASILILPLPLQALNPRSSTPYFLSIMRLEALPFAIAQPPTWYICVRVLSSLAFELHAPLSFHSFTPRMNV